jgi:hypothetical protein
MNTGDVEARPTDLAIAEKHEPDRHAELSAWGDEQDPVDGRVPTPLLSNCRRTD